MKGEVECVPGLFRRQRGDSLGCIPSFMLVQAEDKQGSKISLAMDVLERVFANRGEPDANRGGFN